MDVSKFSKMQNQEVLKTLQNLTVRCLKCTTR